MNDLVRAYGIMQYDLLELTGQEQTVLENAGATIPATWLRPADIPRLVEKTVPEGTLAFILFPDAPGRPESWSAIADMTQKARQSGRYNLIIGLCTWSVTFEQDFILRHGDTLDILLGAGDGPGYVGLYEKDNALFRVRAFGKGKGIHRIVIPSLPEPGKHRWQPGQTIDATFEALDSKVPDDPQIKSIFGR